VALAPGRHGEPAQDFNRSPRTIFVRGTGEAALRSLRRTAACRRTAAGAAWHERRTALEAALPPAGATVSLIDVVDPDPTVHAQLLALSLEG
jgi:hypothetical protein